MEITVRKNGMIEAVLFILFFYILYNPNLFDGTSVFLNQYIIYFGVFSLLVLCFPRHRKIYMQMVQNRYILAYIAGTFVASAYFVFRALWAGVSISDIQALRLIQNNFSTLCLLIILMIVAIMYQWGYTFDDGMNFLFKVATFQGILSVLTLLIPQMKDFANRIYLKDALEFNTDSYILTTRIFGICSDYTYGVPIVHGILAGVCFLYLLTKGRKYFFPFLFIFAMTVLNSRTGVLITIITIIISLFYTVRRKKLSRNSIGFLLVLPFITCLIVIFITMINDHITHFLSALFHDFYALFFKGETQGTIDMLFHTHLYFPEGWNAILFGTGHRLYLASAEQGYGSSDIGFVNDIFMGGILYLLLRYSVILKFISNGTRVSKMRFWRTALYIGLLIANIKGQITVNTAFNVFLLYIVSIELFLPHTDLPIKT